MTEAEAITLADSKFWEAMSFRERAMFQMWEDRLCMPFGVFHEAVEKTLGRPVWTHEFGLNRDGLRAELIGNGVAPTLAEIMEMIPKDKRIVITVTPEEPC
jgi:hypothetical protein